MSDGSLSQDEIEALLQGADDAFSGGPDPVVSTGGASGALTESQKATFLDAAKLIAEQQGTSLSTISTKSASISDVSVNVGGADLYADAVANGALEASVAYSGALNGNAYYYMPKDAATKIAGLMMGQEDSELSEMAQQALKEAYSQMTGAADSAINEKYGGDFSSNPLEVKVVNTAAEASAQGAELVVVKAKLTVEGIADAVPYAMVFDMPLVQAFLTMVTGGGATADAGALDAGGAGDLDSLLGGGPGAGNVGAQQVDFGDLTPAAEVQPQGNISILMDVTMQVTVELGRTTMDIRDILALGEGSIIELDKLAGEPVDLLVNNKSIAKGEVVVIDENFGVRVTEIVDPKDRMSSKM